MVELEVLKVMIPASYLQGVPDSSEAVFGALGRGVAAAPVEGAPAHLEPRPQPPSANVKRPVYIDRHCGERHPTGGESQVNP